MSYSLEDFVERNEKSVEYHLLATKYLMLSGFNVYLTKYEIRKEEERPDRFAQEPDVIISVNDYKAEKIEIKSRNLNFSDIKKYPFKTIYLYNVNKVQKDIPVIIFSQYTKQFLCFCDDGSKRTITDVYDNARKLKYQCFQIDVEHAVSFKEWCSVMKAKLQ